MRIPQPARIGLSTLLLAGGIWLGVKNIESMNYHKSQANDLYKTPAVERILDIKDGTLQNISDIDYFLENRQQCLDDVQEYGSLITDSTNLNNLQEYNSERGHAQTNNFGITFGVILAGLGVLGNIVEIPSYLADRRQRKKQMEGKGRRA